MVLTTAEAVADPTWWPHLWSTVWALTALVLAAWLTCRAAEKHTQLRATGEDDTTPGHDTGGTRSAYDRAA
ncbi:hypothetical protein ACFCXP_16715 [Streptomyces niveus]|uniref:hypothetical protein n=1 Tax=Streptomyces niveus TaxID=193462 RepID=UPI0035DF7063